MNKLYSIVFLVTTNVAFAWPNHNLDLKALEEKAAACNPVISGSQVCAKLKQKSDRLNRLAYELRVNPLKYGQKVLALQEKIQDPRASHKTTQHLKERLAVIKSLESPGS